MNRTTAGLSAAAVPRDAVLGYITEAPGGPADIATFTAAEGMAAGYHNGRRCNGGANTRRRSGAEGTEKDFGTQMNADSRILPAFI